MYLDCCIKHCFRYNRGEICISVEIVGYSDRCSLTVRRDCCLSSGLSTGDSDYDYNLIERVSVSLFTVQEVDPF